MEELDQFIATLDPTRRDYTTGVLVKAFKVAGYPKSNSWLFRQEAKGNLKLPRSTTEYKKANGRIGFVREMSPQMIKRVVMSFSPGGKGYYNFEKDND